MDDKVKENEENEGVVERSLASKMHVQYRLTRRQCEATSFENPHLRLILRFEAETTPAKSQQQLPQSYHCGCRPTPKSSFYV